MRGFRVYDKLDQRMITEPTTDLDRHIVLAGNGNLVTPANWGLYLMDRYIRMDSTGLKDRNGKEIYEGDIVYTHTKDAPYVIEYHTPYASFALHHPKVNFGFRSFDAEECEVIGNIHENSELLEAKP